jgi:hypothetical protein
MSLPNNLVDREFQKFVSTVDGPAVRVEGDISVSPAGLSGGGLVTHVNLTAASWTALPSTPLAGRRSILVQNISGNGNIVLWNYSASAPSTEGPRIEDGAIKTSDLSDSIIVYGRMLAGTGAVSVDEVF